MTTIKSALLGLGMLTAISGSAMAADMAVPADTYSAMGWYLRGDAGVSWLNYGNQDSTSLAVGGGVGYKYSDYLRGDLRGDWAGDSDATLSTVLGNLYFDIPTDTMFTPYVGAGAGYGWATRDAGKDGNGFAFAVMAGTEISLTDNLSADVGYRFREVLSGPDPYDHQVLVGLRYKF